MLLLAPATAAPRIEVMVSVPEEPTRLNVTIARPDGRVGWTCRIDGTVDVWRDGHYVSPCPETHGLYAGPGPYVATAVYRRGRVTTRETLTLVSAEEILASFAISVSADADDLDHPRLRPLTGDRVFAAPPELGLTRAWQPGVDARPAYTVHNGTSTPISGRGGYSGLQGHVERKEGGEWVVYPRGGRCGSFLALGPTAPGETGGSDEGAFIGPPRPFELGEYRWVVDVERADVRGPLWDLWRLTDEFQLPGPRSHEPFLAGPVPEPPEDTP